VIFALLGLVTFQLLYERAGCGRKIHY